MVHVSLTKRSTVIGYPCAYLLNNWSVIMGCLISTFYNQIALIEHLRYIVAQCYSTVRKTDQ